MVANGNIYIEKANFCTRMSEQSRDKEARDNWLWLATQWLSLATTGSIFPFDREPPSAGSDTPAELETAGARPCQPHYPARTRQRAA